MLEPVGVDDSLRTRLIERTKELDQSKREASLLLSCLQEVFIDPTPTPAPRLVVRDECGCYWNPTYPSFPEASTKELIALWEEKHGVEMSTQSAPEAVIDALQEDEEGEGMQVFCQWVPQPPEGQGWFLARICIPEDGDAGALWVRSISAQRQSYDQQLVEYFASLGQRVWSRFRENFSDLTLRELIESEELQAGTKVYTGLIDIPDTDSFVTDQLVSRLIEGIECAANDFAGEAVDDFPSCSEIDRANLAQLIKDWLQSLDHPTWYGVRSIEAYTLTQADIDLANKPTQGAA